jgi:hypothetical protein
MACSHTYQHTQYENNRNLFCIRNGDEEANVFKIELP